MKFESFKFLIDKISESLDKKGLALNAGIDVFDLTSDDEKVIALLLKTYFGYEATEWIDWFVYEKRGDENVKAYDENDVEICRTVEELWEIVEELRKSPTKAEYELPTQITKEEQLSIIYGFYNNYEC